MIYHVAGTFKTRHGNEGRFTYARIDAETASDALSIARERVERRKSYYGGIMASATEARV